IEKIIEDLTRQNAEQRELLNSLSDSMTANSIYISFASTCKGQSICSFVTSTDPNLSQYLDDFSKALASEVRMLLGEVGKLRDKLGYLLYMKSKYGPGGEFEPDWYAAYFAGI
ncbi:hypothetical protein DFH07DRAFT_735865, partial [Mycena maculata]